MIYAFYTEKDGHREWAYGRRSVMDSMRGTAILGGITVSSLLWFCSESGKMQEEGRG